MNHAEVGFWGIQQFIALFLVLLSVPGAYVWFRTFRLMQFELFQGLLPRKQVAVYSLFGMAAELSRADGRVDEEEVRVLQRFVREVLFVSTHLESLGAEVFREARHRRHGFAWYARIFADQFAKEPAVLFSVLYLLFDIAEADGIISSGEEDCLACLAAEMYVSEERFRSLLANKTARVSSWQSGFSRQQRRAAQEEHAESTPRQPANSLAQAYVILGCTPEMEFKSIRDQYRALVKEKHPDAFVGAKATAETIESAAEEFQRIQDAFDLIREHRAE